MLKSCETCPSCVKAPDVPVRFKKATEADVCVTTGNILSRPGQTDGENERIKIAFADKCPSYGKPALAKPNAFLAAQVGIGDPAVIARMAAVAPDDRIAPASCVDCANFIPADVVKKELGWTLGMCSAKGRLLFPSNMTSEAATCGQGDKGPVRDSTDGVILFPEYDAGNAFAAPVAATRSSGPRDLDKDRIDPRDYVTDKPVSDDERAAHIRAWRRVVDPEGLKPDLFLPIFDGRTLCGFEPRTTYGGHRPDLYIDYQNLLYDLTVQMHEEDMTPLLIGGAGSGKTECGCWMAYLMDLPFVRLPVKPEMDPAEFIGAGELTTDPVTGTPVTGFKKGPFTEAFTSPCVEMIDELNMNSAIEAMARPALDSARMLLVDGVALYKNDYCFPMCSQNPASDPIYVGTQPLSAAGMDRLNPLLMEAPPENIERLIIQTHCVDGEYNIDTRTLDQIMQIATDLRALIRDGSLPIAWGMRSQIKVAKLTKYFSLAKSYRRAVVDGLDQEQQDSIMNVVTTVVGGR